MPNILYPSENSYCLSGLHFFNIFPCRIIMRFSLNNSMLMMFLVLLKFNLLKLFSGNKQIIIHLVSYFWKKIFHGNCIIYIHKYLGTAVKLIIFARGLCRVLSGNKEREESLAQRAIR